MEIARDELLSVLGQFNPWWRNERIPDLPDWRRSAAKELQTWVKNPPAPRAVLLSGARQVGKTTLLLQSIRELLDSGVPAANILYATFDHPILRLAGMDAVLEAWRQREPQVEGPEYLFLDEAQLMRDWGTWIKHQVDFFRRRRIVFTGSSMPLLEAGQESGVGRWHTLRLTTLTFSEYIQLKGVQLPVLPEVRDPLDLFETAEANILRMREAGRAYTGHFHEYLVRGGFPQTAQVESVTQAQRLLREDIVDKVLKRDMTALFGVRRVLDLEQTFLYLCMHDGGLLDMPTLCSNLEVKRPTAQHFIEILEATHLIYRVPPLGYGKEVLRGRFKVYLADPAIAPAVMLRGKSVLDDPTALGMAVETAVLTHLLATRSWEQARISYWRGKRDHEVDFVVANGARLIPFEVKYRAEPGRSRQLQGLLEFAVEKGIRHGFVVSRSIDDFGRLGWAETRGAKILQVPAALLCFWLGATPPPK